MQAPAQLGHRRRRLSDEETARRMLDTALDLVNRAGLTVSLEHISFEDVIRAADVSRSAAYRRWPYKDLFFHDLLKELAAAAAPAAAVNEETTRATLGRIVAAHADRLADPAGRHDLVSELIRQGAVNDFEAMYRSTEWRTYLALHATFLSLPEGELRAEVQATLVRSERGFIERIARSWELLTAALGYRLRPGSGGSFTTIATLASAGVRGLVIMSLADPEQVDYRVAANPAGASAAADWSLAGLAGVGIAMMFLEPDPDITWDEQRLASLRELLAPGGPPAGDRAGTD